MAYICATGTMGRLKSWHIYVPLALDGLIKGFQKSNLILFFIEENVKSVTIDRINILF